jgi:ribonuclease D
MQTRAYKIKNPYRIDQQTRHEVLISDTLSHDYSNVSWVSLDTEYLSFNPLQDKLCTIQVASKDPNSGELRSEIVYVYEKEICNPLKELLTNPNIEKIFHVFSSDVPRIENYIQEKIQGEIFDTKVAARIAWTNTQDHGMKNLIKMFVDPSFNQVDCEKGLNDWEIGPENWSDEQILYMIQDVIYLDVLKSRILEMAKRRGTKSLILDTMKILPQIAELYKKGYSESVLGY